MKPHRRLTGARIAEARRSKREQWLSDDDGSRGSWRLICRVSPVGSVRFYVRLSASQNPKKPSVPMGLYSRVAKPGYLTLAQAQVQAGAVVAALSTGKLPDPKAAVCASGMHARHLGSEGARGVDSRSNAASVPKNELSIVGEHPASVIDVCNAYVEHLKRENKIDTAIDVQQRFRLYVAPSPIANVPAHEVQPEACLELIRSMIRAFENNPINRRGQPRGLLTPDRVRQYLSSAYQYVIDARKDALFTGQSIRFSLITRNPVKEGVKPLKGVEKARDRNLSPSELGTVWRKLCADERLAARVVRLTLLLGGQRMKQLLRVRVLNVDLEAETILLFDGKGGREVPRAHLLPLMPMALREVLDLLEFSKNCRSPYLMPGRSSDKHIMPNTVSRYVTTLSRTLVAQSTADRTDVKIERFQFSDLRRTMETRLAATLTKDTRAQLLSHGLSGVQDKHYDKYDYLPQKREALSKVEDMFKGFAGP